MAQALLQIHRLLAGQDLRCEGQDALGQFGLGDAENLYKVQGGEQARAQGISGHAPSLQHPPPLLIPLDTAKQGAKVALAKAQVVLPLNELDEDGTDHVLGEDL